MTESVRKRKSKWDLKADIPLPTESEHGNAWLVKSGEPIHDKDSNPPSAQIYGCHDTKWSEVEANNGMKSKDNSGRSYWGSVPEDRGAHKDENTIRDCNEFSKTAVAWGGDQSYNTSMSPILDTWRHQNHSRSPNSGWSRSSRSRSRSPSHGCKREREEWNDRTRIVSVPPCKDFVAGRCRRGTQCRFLHQDNRHYEGRRHSESGSAESWGSRYERGRSSRHANTEEEWDYSRDKVSHGYVNNYNGDREKHEHPRTNISNISCNDFLKGKCYRGSSCKFAHHGVLADGHVGWSTKEVTRETADNKRDTNASFAPDYRRERRSDIPCKFFPFGKCRNGEYCSFSHDVPVRGSPEGRSCDNRWDHNLDNESKSRGGRKWSDRKAVLDIPSMGDHGGEIMSAPEPRSTGRSMDGTWEHSLENETGTWGGSTWSNKAAAHNVHTSPQWRIENCGVSMGTCELRGREKSFDGTRIPSEASNNARYYHSIDIIDSGGIPQDSQFRTLSEITLPAHSKNMTEEIAAGLQQQAATVMVQPMVSENAYIQRDSSLRDAAAAFHCRDSIAITNNGRLHNEIITSANSLPLVPLPGQNYNQDGQSIDTRVSSRFNENGQNLHELPSHPQSGQNFNLSGQGQQVISASLSNSQSQKLVHEGESIKKPDIMEAKISQITSGTPVIPNLVTSEQVAKIKNLSASLAQIFGNGQQLPQLYAALNTPNAMGLVHSLPNSAETVAPFNQLNQVNCSVEHYGPVADSIELSKPDTCYQPPGFDANPVEQRNTVVEESLVPLSVSGGPGVDPSVSGGPGVSKKERHESHDVKQLDPVADSEANEKNESEADKSKKGHENGHSDDMEADGSDDEEAKKSKDAKGMRLFKFSLVEFTKEILKPTWKEGQMSKEAHKTIVKKVVDKVTGTHGAQFPQTQEKIDQYLSYSKPKLTKLVQAYLEKYLKS